VAIANALKASGRAGEILFVGAQGRMEMEKVPAAGYKIVGLPVAGINRRNLLKNFTVPFKLWKSIRKARKVVKDFRPDVVVGVGGYASWPTLYVASRRGIPTLIQEQNSYAGLSNKMLGKRVDRVCVAYGAMERFFPKGKIVITGNPVRADVVQIAGKRDEALKHFGLAGDKPIILSLGGSLGARTINQSIAAGLEKIRQSGNRIIWQTGKSYYAQAKTQVDGNDPDIRVKEFIYRMDLAYAAADVIISRAGAITISELCLLGKPVILVPSPNVAEDHQAKNAMTLVKNKAALMVSDADAQVKMLDEAFALLQNKEKQEELGKQILKLAYAKSDVKIAEEIIKLTESKKA
jgi:UDP-N-acetylglucosamine--N-acetylmuramyl-(pentapeptide) pyrophosphoryl-undecaprenol N-acetylglucosamine transferase